MSNTLHKPSHYIIVPDGISYDKQDSTLLKPSFIYRQVLDYALKISRDGDFLYLAPANTCKGKSEHELAHAYILETTTKQLQIYCPSVHLSGYIDTYGNAIHLKELLGDSILCTPCELISANIHSYRAEYCFRKTGFHIQKVHRVPYRTTREAVMGRWWYYNYKPLHCIYSVLALARDIIKANSPALHNFL